MRKFLVAASVAMLIVAAARMARAQNIASEALRTVTTLYAEDEELKRIPVGTAFFVEVPSNSFPGSSFVYLVTTRHNLFDSEGQPYEKLFVQLDDGHGARFEPVPEASQWIMDPHNPGADIVALPIAPSNANYETVSIMRFLNGSKETMLPPKDQVGNDAYYITTVPGTSRITPVTRFGKVSVATPSAVQIPGMGTQYFYFLEGASPPELSGAPVFLKTKGDVILWGLVESKSDPNRRFSGLIAVLPVGYVGETVKAMADQQDVKPAPGIGKPAPSLPSPLRGALPPRHKR